MASHVFGCRMIALSSATMSSRSWIIARHHAFFTLRLEQDAVVAVVVRGAEPAVDLGGLEQEAAALAEGDDLVHRHDVGASVAMCAERSGWPGNSGFRGSLLSEHVVIANTGFYDRRDIPFLG